MVDAILAFWSTHLLVVVMELCVPIAAWHGYHFQKPANRLEMLNDVQWGSTSYQLYRYIREIERFHCQRSTTYEFLK